MPLENMEIPEHESALIQRYIEEGRYGSAADEISAGLTLLEERDREDRAKLEQLRREARKGIDDLESGRYIEVDSGEGLDTYVASVRERGLASFREAGIDARTPADQ